jgi:hypothetical protein
MYLTKRLATFAAVGAVMAAGAPVASAGAATPPFPAAAFPFMDPTTAVTYAPITVANPPMAVTDSAQGSPSCPVGYSGPTNLATGCPWWMMR